ncbi:MAG: hypothetical protein JO078_06285 [Candidatus Eremiobacteraeota bacterium]|nr:hypothetical protein [Bryobacterales bacterium]MBV9699713.1 hypothetical protein [Candidatus Eremiobacteraeota bacterium]
MPTWFPSYTNCSSPSGYYGIPAWALALIGGVGVAALIALAVAGSWAPGVAAFLATVCLAGITFCSWWLNVRLICLGGDRSAIGAIYHLEPPNPTLDPFAFGDYDTDYSFNLLLWPFTPKHELPNSFVSNQWSSSATPALITDWPTLPSSIVPAIPFSEVESQVELILAQQSMASLGLGFTGQDVESGDEPAPQPAAGSSQHFLLHCEIEGPGMYDLRILLWVLFGVFIVAAALSLIPVIGSILSWILSILAFLAFLFGGAAITHEDASPPTTGGWGGSFNPYDGAGNPNGQVDIAYVFGRWVYDSLHTGWNELHPLHFMIKIGSTTQGNLANGNWGIPDIPDLLQNLNDKYNVINSPSTPAAQQQPQNQWNLHPLLDGCLGPEPYPQPPPPGQNIQ